MVFIISVLDLSVVDGAYQSASLKKYTALLSVTWFGKSLVEKEAYGFEVIWRKMWSFIFIFLIPNVIADNFPTYYNGNNKIVLGLEKGFQVQISNGKEKATFELPNNKSSTVSGTSEVYEQIHQKFDLDISFKNVDGINNTGKINTADLKFEIIYNSTLG